MDQTPETNPPPPVSLLALAAEEDLHSRSPSAHPAQEKLLYNSNTSSSRWPPSPRPSTPSSKSTASLSSHISINHNYNSTSPRTVLQPQKPQRRHRDLDRLEDAQWTAIRHATTSSSDQDHQASQPNDPWPRTYSSQNTFTVSSSSSFSSRLSHPLARPVVYDRGTYDHPTLYQQLIGGPGGPNGPAGSRSHPGQQRYGSPTGRRSRSGSQDGYYHPGDGPVPIEYEQGPHRIREVTPGHDRQQERWQRGESSSSRQDMASVVHKRDTWQPGPRKRDINDEDERDPRPISIPGSSAATTGQSPSHQYSSSYPKSQHSHSSLDGHLRARAHPHEDAGVGLGVGAAMPPSPSSCSPHSYSSVAPHHSGSPSARVVVVSSENAHNRRHNDRFESLDRNTSRAEYSPLQSDLPRRSLHLEHHAQVPAAFMDKRPSISTPSSSSSPSLPRPPSHRFISQTATRTPLHEDVSSGEFAFAQYQKQQQDQRPSHSHSPQEHSVQYAQGAEGQDRHDRRDHHDLRVSTSTSRSHSLSQAQQKQQHHQQQQQHQHYHHHPPLEPASTGIAPSYAPHSGEHHRPDKFAPQQHLHQQQQHHRHHSQQHQQHYSAHSPSPSHPPHPPHHPHPLHPTSSTPSSVQHAHTSYSSSAPSASASSFSSHNRPSGSSSPVPFSKHGPVPPSSQFPPRQRHQQHDREVLNDSGGETSSYPHRQDTAYGNYREDEQTSGPRPSLGGSGLEVSGFDIGGGGDDSSRDSSRTRWNPSQSSESGPGNMHHKFGTDMPTTIDLKSAIETCDMLCKFALHFASQDPKDTQPLDVNEPERPPDQLTRANLHTIRNLNSTMLTGLHAPSSQHPRGDGSSAADRVDMKNEESIAGGGELPASTDTTMADGTAEYDNEEDGYGPKFGLGPPANEMVHEFAKASTSIFQLAIRIKAWVSMTPEERELDEEINIIRGKRCLFMDGSTTMPLPTVEGYGQHQYQQQQQQQQQQGGGDEWSGRQDDQGRFKGPYDRVGEHDSSSSMGHQQGFKRPADNNMDLRMHSERDRERDYSQYSTPMGSYISVTSSQGGMAASLTGPFNDKLLGGALMQTKSTTSLTTLDNNNGGHNSNNGDSPHQKYRKRAKRTHPPGRCLSCDSSDTPEWRRGPDGARTLCNACGLHYAKLLKRQSQQLQQQQQQMLQNGGQSQGSGTGVNANNAVSPISSSMQQLQNITFQFRRLPQSLSPPHGNSGSGGGGGVGEDDGQGSSLSPTNAMPLNAVASEMMEQDAPHPPPAVPQESMPAAS